MDSSSFDALDQAINSGGAAAAFDRLVQTALDAANYPLLFEARLLRKRHELGLPLVQPVSLEELPAGQRGPYEKEFVETAREVGRLFLAAGDIPRAFSYLRAVGETAPIAEAMDKMKPADAGDAVIQIAFYEGVHPRRGFEMILSNYGICRAITSFGQFPSREGRTESLQLLVRTLHGELVERLRNSILQTEGEAPQSKRVPELIANRDYLFEGMSYYVDTSHLVSIITYSIELEDRETLELVLELTEYGKRLSPMFHYKGDPPFDNVYEDHAIYVRALLGQDVDVAIAHFRRKIEEQDPDQWTSVPAQTLVNLLGRLARYREAVEVSLAYLKDVEPQHLACPNVIQLCDMAGDYDRLMELARERGDLLNFGAALALSRSESKSPDPAVLPQ